MKEIVSILYLVECLKLWGVSVALLCWVLYRKSKSKFDWTLRTAITGTYVIWMYLAGGWDVVGFYGRYIILALFVFSAGYSIRKIRDLPVVRAQGVGWWFSLVGRICLLIIFAGICLLCLMAYRSPVTTLDLAYPLRDGKYYVRHGGSNAALNYHAVIESAQYYALDISALSPFGFRANGFLPRELSKYAIFGHIVHSPCAGTIVEVVDGISDQVPPEMNPEAPAGNYVVINSHDTYVVLAHLQRGSVRVQKGDEVKAGEPLGLVGNSGNSSEPHLHIHAVDIGNSELNHESISFTGKAIPVRFGGRFLTRNSRF